MINKHTLAYIAGYTDGDGCFHIRKTIRKSTGSAKYSCSFIISSTDPDIIQFLIETFPGIRRISEDGKRSEKRKEAEIYCKFIESCSGEEKEIMMNRLKEVKNNCNLVEKRDKEILNFYKSLSNALPSDLDYAYLAGLIDAECSLGIFRYRTKNRDNSMW